MLRKHGYISLALCLQATIKVACAVTPPVNVDLANSTEADFSPMARIVGGDVVEERIPWMVSINAPSYGSFGAHYCGGTLISNDWVLTAAHCLEDYGSQALYHTIEIGKSSQYSQDEMHTSGISQITCHEDFDSYYLQNDICLLKLSSPAPDTIQVARINFDPAIPAVGDPLSYIGWGLMNEQGSVLPDQLRGVSVDTIDTLLCSRVYGELVTNKNICTYKLGKDSCQGDSGGPLIAPGADGTLASGTVVGVVSFGEGCARRNYPGVNSRISAFQDWIEGIVTGVSIPAIPDRVAVASPDIVDGEDVVAVPNPVPPVTNTNPPVITVVYINDDQPQVTGNDTEQVISVISSEDVSIWDIFNGMLSDIFSRSATLMDRAEIQSSVAQLADIQKKIAAELDVLTRKLDGSELGR
ncbi:hypothetical protein SARC_10660 [Sphaeroforma arctica JP610]|uniref:Peptidase S1 domain-containing protein n=1 Tax=Sphaeroforma arctica JP610 TaxID=667725 RepID=A0A0L0FJA1_9EUKA|nr:hypothetical protein SARC_10660 [Sphaeroforma arctica JP610]KNC76862.1 hypothetical protein SARC_10660 [Sphaeroforma arctica JP610]|eukprot:XP_014150764.1 hypothetical protein SARC_10660 [Sphaeroforma arctica JP610]